jgi:hypothetical protein
MMKSVKKSFNLSNKLIVIIGIIAIIGGIGIYYAKAPHAPIPAAALAIDGIGCNPMEQSVFHVHAHINIIIDDAYFLVPSQIGIPSTGTDFTLGQLFEKNYSKKK